MCSNSGAVRYIVIGQQAVALAQALRAEVWKSAFLYRVIVYAQYPQQIKNYIYLEARRLSCVQCIMHAIVIPMKTKDIKQGERTEQLDINNITGSIEQLFGMIRKGPEKLEEVKTGILSEFAEDGDTTQEDILAASKIIDAANAAIAVFSKRGSAQEAYDALIGKLGSPLEESEPAEGQRYVSYAEQIGFAAGIALAFFEPRKSNSADTDIEMSALRRAFVDYCIEETPRRFSGMTVDPEAIVEEHRNSPD